MPPPLVAHLTLACLQLVIWSCLGLSTACDIIHLHNVFLCLQLCLSGSVTLTLLFWDIPVKLSWEVF